MGDPETRLLAEVSRDHYLAGLSKVEIARERGLSRFQVARLLDRARELGVVRIEVAVPPYLDPGRATALARRLGIQEVVVAEGGRDHESARANVARSLARVLGARIARGARVGLSWSRTIDAAADHLSALPPCDVVQLVGALSVGGTVRHDLVERLAAMHGVRAWPLWAPLLVDDGTTALGIRSQPEIAEALRRADDLDLAVVAIGSWSAHTSTVFGRVSPAEREAVLAAGGVAETSGRVVDASGRSVPSPFDERVIGVRVDQLVRTPEVIAVGYGTAAATGLRAAVAGGFADVLVVDDDAATELERITDVPEGPAALAP